MGITRLLRREKTNPRTRGTVTFNSSSTFVPVYGKTNFKVGGVGTPGNPSSGGNYANTNPGSGGNASYNPPTGGNYAGSNPGVYSWGENGYAYSNYTYANPQSPVPSPYNSFDSFGNPTGNTQTYFYASYTANTLNQVFVIGQFHYDGGGPAPASPTYSDSGNYHEVSNYFNIGSNPGNPYYNPTSPGNVYYNPYSPGNANYNPTSPGNPGTPVSTLGVTFPGGSGGATAPYVTPTSVPLSYTSAGVSVTVPPGGYVEITNN